MKQANRTKLFALFFLSASLLPRPAAAEDPKPRMALGLDSPDVTKYAVRLRASGRVFDKAKVSVRDLLGKFTIPKSTYNSNFESSAGGFNEILDPGYDITTTSAGGVRTTPLQMMWSWRDDTCAGNDAACLALDKHASKRFHWLQVRKPGAECNKDDLVNVPAAACTPGGDTVGNGGQDNYGVSVAGGVLCNQRGVPPYWQGNMREHGFYVNVDGNCFSEQNVCMNNKGASTRPAGDPGGYCMDDTCTTHQYNELGTLCDMDAQYVEPAYEIYMNVGVFIFPNGLVENAGAGAAFAVPDWARPVTLNYAAAGDYFGYVPTKRYGTYTGVSGAPFALRRSQNTDPTLTTSYWYAGGFPPATGVGYNPADAFHEYAGSYFRQGDDIAFYADVRQMQIHSIDRDAVSIANHNNDARAVAGCGDSWVYTGQVDAENKPVYFLAKVPQCLRPKAYWHGPPNVAAAQSKYQWVACNAYDTFLSDGWTLNPSRDDNYKIYPGDNAANTCGAQVDQWQPYTATGAGTGWSALRLDTFELDSQNNKVNFKLTGNDWRLELSMYYAFATECIVAVSYTSPTCDSRPGYQQKRKWAQGVVMLKDVVLQGSVKLFTYDERSCTAAGGDCNDPWGPQNDGMVRPDRVRIGLDLPTVSLAMYPDPPVGNWGAGWGTQRNAYRAIYGDLSGYGRSCFAIVYDECAFAMARFDNPDVDGTQAAPELILPQITAALGSEFNNQFRTLIEDTVQDLNDGIPALSALLGDPWDFGKSLVDAGIFLTGSAADSSPDQTNPARNVWVVPFKAPVSSRDAVIDINAALGFRPIAFESPIPASQILKVDDPSNGIAASSFFAKATMVYPDTAACKIDIKGNTAMFIANSTGTALGYVQTGTLFTYDTNTGWLSGIGVTPLGAAFGQAFINRVNWKWGLIADVHKAGLSPANAYKIDKARGAAPGDGAFQASAAWGVSYGWIKLSAPTAGLIANIRVGDLFYLNAFPNQKYRVIAINAANLAIQINWAEGQANRFTPFRVDNTAASAWTIVSRSCSRDATLYPTIITDATYDYGDYAVDRAFTDTRTGTSYSGRSVIQPYYMADASMETAPSWCTLPSRVRADQDALATRFPMRTWLAFGASDAPPAGFDASLSLPNPSSYTLGGWDYLATSYNAVASEQLVYSDDAIVAETRARGAWGQVNTANVSGANAAKALVSGNMTLDKLDMGFISQPRASTTYNVWVASSRVAATPQAAQQISKSDNVMWTASTSRGAWIRTTTGTSFANPSGAAGAMRSNGVNDTLTSVFATNMPAGTVFNVWVAHARVAVAACVAPCDPTLTVRVDGAQVGTTIKWTDDNTWRWTRLGSVTLGPLATHNISFNCTAANNSKMCGVDGIVITTKSMDPSTDANFNPYGTANWDLAALTYYDDGTVRAAVNTSLVVRIDGTQVGLAYSQTADNTWSWRNFGSIALTGGPHTLQLECTAGNNSRCGIDGVMLTTLATNPASAAGFTPYTTAAWDATALDSYSAAAGTAARGIVRANQNDFAQKELAATEYDLSVHLHQRTLNQLAMAVVGSGSACLEFADTDPETGEETLWADFMTAERFAAFVPEFASKFKGWKVKVYISPQQSPRVRTGVGSLTKAAMPAGSAPINAEPYTLAAAFPDLQVNFVAVDPKTSNEITVLKLNWNATVGLYLRAMRQCHDLDPMKLSTECTSLDPYLRTITGYWQLYLDYGEPALGLEFESPANTIDGFLQGRFTRGDFVCPTCTPNPIAAGRAKFEVIAANCGTGCNKVGLANSITTLLDSAVSLYLDTRASTTFLSLPLNFDILYVGPDGPNDDNLGTNFVGSRGDYLGVYLRMFGKSLDLMGLVNGLTTMLAPPPSYIPQATVPQLEASPFVPSHSPSFDVALRDAGGASAPNASYTYRLDGGFWRTPRAEPRIELRDLTEGSHRLEIRSVVETEKGWVNQLTPTALSFVVDSLPPELSILPSKSGTYDAGAQIEYADLQTPEDKILVEYSLDDAGWKPVEGKSVGLRRAKEGRHVLRVRATDLAGNTAETAREVVVMHRAGCGCRSGGADDAAGTALVLLALLTAHLYLRRRRRG